MIDAILNPEDVRSISLLQAAIRSLQIFNIFERALATDPIVDFYFDVSNLLVKDSVEVLEDRGIVIMIEILVDLAGLLLL